MRHFAIVLCLLGILVAGMAGLFVWSRFHEAARLQEALHLEVAERIFNECERRLTLLLAEEEERPFDHYRYFYVPGDLAPGSVALNRSPLARPPDELFIQGYFQFDHEGIYNNPRRPDNPELANEGFGWKEDPRLAEYDRAIRELFGGDTRRAQAQTAGQTDPVPQQKRLAEPEQIAEAAGQTSGPERDVPHRWSAQAEKSVGQTYVQRGKGVQSVLVPIEDEEDGNDYANDLANSQVGGIYNQRRQQQVKLEQVEANKAQRFLNPNANRVDAEVYRRNFVRNQGGQLQQEPVKQGGEATADGQAAPPSQRRDAGGEPGEELARYRSQLLLTEELLGLEPQASEAVLHPFRARPLDPDRLALVRQVEIAGRDYRQGFVIDYPALARELQGSVLANRPLAAVVALHWRWDGTPVPPLPADKAYRFVRSFADPFADLTAHCDLPVLSDRRVPGLGMVGWLVIGIGGALLTGFIAIYRMVASRVEFARRRSDFVSAVTHELKTPLTSIRMYGEMLAEDMVPDEERRRSYYRTITAEGERLGRLVDNVLELSKLEHGSRRLRPEGGDPRRVIVRCLEMMDPHAREQGFALRLEVPEDAAMAARFDGEALLQVLVNLVDNAIKFSRDTATKEVVLALDEHDGRIRLQVRDHGPGVPAAQLRRIFEPFYRGEREATRRTKGTGIGLALVKGLVERMGGHLHARNRPAGGLEVSIELAAA